MTIGEISRRCGLRSSAIRYYEAAGLLPKPPRTAGRRVYGAETINRIAFIQFAQEAGFSLAEIRLLSGSGGPASPFSARMRKFAEKKIDEVDQLMRRATLMKTMLTRSLACQCLDTVECGARILAAGKRR